MEVWCCCPLIIIIIIIITTIIIIIVIVIKVNRQGIVYIQLLVLMLK